MLKKYGFTNLPPLLFEKAITITDWEAQSRYHDDLVATREEIQACIQLYFDLREIVEAALHAK